MGKAKVSPPVAALRLACVMTELRGAQPLTYRGKQRVRDELLTSLAELGTGTTLAGQQPRPCEALAGLKLAILGALEVGAEGPDIVAAVNDALDQGRFR